MKRNEVLIYNMDEPWKNDAEWKKPVTEDHILYDPIHYENSEEGIYRNKVN